MTSNWTLTVTHPTTSVSTDLEFFVDGEESLQFSRAVEEQLLLIPRHKVESTFLFREASYDWFAAVDDDAVARCLEISATLKYGSTTVANGTFSTGKGDRWPDRKQFRLRLDSIDDNKCWLDSMKEKKNVLLGQTYTLQVYQGSLRFHTSQETFLPNVSGFFQFPTTNLPAPQAHWEVFRWELFRTQTAGFIDQVTVTWATYDDGAGNFDKPFVTIDSANTDRSFNPPDDVDYHYQNKIVAESGEIDNARRLEDIVNVFVSDCSLSVQSNFFGWGTNQNDSPTNDAYTFAATHLQDVFYLQKSDVIRSDAENNATRSEINLEELLSNLRAVYGVYAFAENGMFRVEHISHFYNNPSVTMDFTTGNNALYIQGADRYEYSEERLPRYISFSYMEQSSDDFEGDDFVFPVACSENRTEERIANKAQGDIAHIFGNDSISDTGFVLVATEFSNGQYVIKKGTNPNETTRLLNFPHTWKNLQVLHRFELPNTSYTVDGVAQTALSTAPNRELNDLKVLGVSPVDWAAMSGIPFFTIGLGNARAESIDYDAQGGKLTIKPLV